MKKVIFKDLIEAYHYRLDLEITFDKDINDEEKQIIDNTIDKFMLVNNITYNSILNDVKYLKTLYESLQEKISTKILKMKVFDKLNKKESANFKIEPTLF